MAISPVFNFVAGAVGAVNDIAIGARISQGEERKAAAKLSGEKQIASLKHGYDLTLQKDRQAAEAKIRESLLGTELAAKVKEGNLDRISREKIAGINANASGAASALSAAKNFDYLGDRKTIDHYRFPRVSGTKVERTDAIFAALSSDSAKYKRMKELHPHQMKQTLARAFGRLITEEAEKDSEHNIKRYLPAMTSARLSGITEKANPELYKDLKEINQLNFETAFGPKDIMGFNKIMGGILASDRVTNPEHAEILKKSMLGWQKGQIKDYSKAELPEIFSAYTADTTHYSLTNERGQPNGEHDPATLKFHEFGASPMVDLLHKETPTSADRDAAYQWLFNDENKKNWIDSDGMLNQDFFDAIKMFSLKNALSSRTRHRQRGRFQETNIAAGLSQRRHEAYQASFKQAIENRPLAEKALETLTKLQTSVRSGDMGSRTMVRVFAGVTAIPEMISEIRRGFNGNINREIIDHKGNTVRYMNKALADQVSKAFGIVGNFQAGVQPSKYDALAMQGALETILAYQVTSILQGGTGGRTISDTDVRLTMQLFGGNFTTVQRRLNHLENVKSLVRTAIHRGRVYELLESADTNFATYKSVKNVLKLFPQLEDDMGNLGLGQQLQHVSNRSGRQAGKDPLDLEQDSNIEGVLARVANAKKHNSAVYTSSDNSGLNDWLTKYLVPGSFKVDSNGQNIKNFIINEKKNNEGVLTHSLVMDRDSWKRIKKAKQKSDKVGNPSFIKVAIEDASKEAFNILTNESVTIKWDESGNGSYDIVGPGSIGRIPTAVPVPKKSVGEESDTYIGDNIVTSIINIGNFAAVGKDPYKNATPEAINQLIPYIKSLYKLEIAPKNTYTNFDAATGVRPNWFAQEAWKTATTIGGNKFGWADHIKHKGGVERWQMPLELGKKTLEHMARTAIGEAAAIGKTKEDILKGQKAVIDVMFIRTHHPSKTFEQQRQGANSPNKKSNQAFFSNVLKKVRV